MENKFMREVLLDIINHTHGLGSITEFKVTGSSTETRIDAMDDNHIVVVKGELKTALPELIGEFGVNRPEMLKGLLGDPTYKADDAKIELVRDGSIPKRIDFSDGSGNDTSEYFLMNANLCKDYYNFKGAAWNVSFTPSKSSISKFSYRAGLTGAEGETFTVKTNNNGDVVIAIGENSIKSEFVFGEGTGANFNSQNRWSTNHVLAALKFDEGVSEVSIFDDPRSGALQVAVTTDFAEWKYIFPIIK